MHNRLGPATQLVRAAHSTSPLRHFFLSHTPKGAYFHIPKQASYFLKCCAYVEPLVEAVLQPWVPRSLKAPQFHAS